MKASSLIASTLIIWLCSCTAGKVGPSEILPSTRATTFPTALSQEIAGTLAHFPNESQLAVAILQNDQVLFCGLERKNDTIAPVNNSNSVFEIGSISKVFTTHLLINALNDQLIDSLEAPIKPYCPFQIKGDPMITFLQLANHTSGLPGNISGNIFNTKPSNPFRRWDGEKLSRYLSKDVALNSPPGESYAYSNVGMAVLGNTICSLRSKSYEALLQQEIFQPLKMEQSTASRAKVNGTLVQGHNPKGAPTDNWDLAAFEGAGAVLSTTADLSKYLRWSLSALASELSPMQQPTKEVTTSLGVALGWHFIKGKTQSPYLWHNGGTGGYKSAMGLNLTNSTGVIILSNISGVDNPEKKRIDQLSHQLMQNLEQ